MRTRRLGNTDLELTTVGLGTWAIGGSWQFGWGHQDDNDSIAAITEAIDCGINWLDTAPIYGCGDSEAVIGRILKDISAKPIIATKCSLRWNEKREKYSSLKNDSIIEECENSLKRLGVEVIDLYQIHWPGESEQFLEGWEAMAKLVRQGKVRYIGVSNFSVSQLEAIAAIHPVASLQPPYSMIHRDVEEELLRYCQANNIGVICYSPMQKGLLTGTFSRQRMDSLAPDDHRRKDPDFIGRRLQINLELAENLKPIAKRNGITLAQLAIAWTLRRQEVTAAIVGARKSGQIIETVKASDFVLSDEDISEIEDLLKKRETQVLEL